MSSATHLTRIQNARNTIRTKLVDFGLVNSTAKIEVLATAVQGIENRGAVNAQVKEGETYTIPRGYHNGSGVVSGSSGGGNYSLQEKTITPTKEQQSVTPDTGYYGLSGVTIAAIPSNYNDTSAVTAQASEVLANKIIVDANGDTVAGTMPNNGTVSKNLDISTVSFTIPKGYHSGNGTVSIVTEQKTVTPTTAKQTIPASSGKVISSVIVNAIPAQFADTSDGSATAESILYGEIAYVDGERITGSMANNGDITASFDGLTSTSVTVPAGYTTGGVISLTDDIEEALAAI